MAKVNNSTDMKCDLAILKFKFQILQPQSYKENYSLMKIKFKGYNYEIYEK